MGAAAPNLERGDRISSRTFINPGYKSDNARASVLSLSLSLSRFYRVNVNRAPPARPSRVRSSPKVSSKLRDIVRDIVRRKTDTFVEARHVSTLFPLETDKRSPLEPPSPLRLYLFGFSLTRSRCSGCIDSRTLVSKRETLTRPISSESLAFGLWRRCRESIVLFRKLKKNSLEGNREHSLALLTILIDESLGSISDARSSWTINENYRHYPPQRQSI